MSPFSLNLVFPTKLNGFLFRFPEITGFISDVPAPTFGSIILSSDKNR